MKKIVKDNLRYLAFTEIYQKTSVPKAQRKAFFLIEAMIYCLSRKGFSRISLAMVARQAGVSKPLLRHYFTNLDEMLVVAIKYIRLHFQQIAIDAISKQKQPDQMIEAYLNSCFHWVKEFSDNSRVWLAFLHLCSHQKKFRELNTLAVQAGEDRIESMIYAGIQTGFFNTSDARAAAKNLQVFITGALVSYVSEDLVDRKAFQESVCKHCLQIAKSST